MQAQSQFSLMKQRRFLPLFFTQFFGAFNDNLFKQALLVYITFYSAGHIAAHAESYALLSLALLIAPFFLFSATAGQIADKFEKSRLIRLIKVLEILLMLCAAAAFYMQSMPVLLVLLFLLGTQSALFGPVKYSILPQHLSEAELTGGNGMVETGTFVAILLGTIAGGAAIGWGEAGTAAIGAMLLVCAVAGYLSSRFIPRASPASPQLRINWNIFTETRAILALTRRHRTVFLSVLGISWFWGLGGVYLSLIPEFVKDQLGYNQHVANVFFATFSIGIGAGSMLCEKLSGQKVEIGLVPFGSIGLTLFGIDFYFAAGDAQATTGELQSLVMFWAQSGAQWQNGRLLLDIFMMGLFGGFYIVPLYALVQLRSETACRSRIIAGNNILNAVAVVVMAVFTMGLAGLGLTLPAIFLVLALCNAAAAVYIYSLVPEFLMRFMVWLLVHSIYRVNKQGLAHIPDQGPVVLVCNHVSYVDALVIGGCIRRPVRFVMYHKIYHLPVLHFVFRTARAIPIAGAKEDPVMLERAYDAIASALEAGDVVCLFPEGRLTGDGDIQRFKTGIEKILNRTPAVTVPMALQGLWGSLFSRGSRLSSLKDAFQRFWSKIGMVVGTPIQPAEVTAARLQQAVGDLRGPWK